MSKNLHCVNACDLKVLTNLNLSKTFAKSEFLYLMQVILIPNSKPAQRWVFPDFRKYKGQIISLSYSIGTVMRTQGFHTLSTARSLKIRNTLCSNLKNVESSLITEPLYHKSEGALTSYVDKFLAFDHLLTYLVCMLTFSML